MAKSSYNSVFSKGPGSIGKLPDLAAKQQSKKPVSTTGQSAAYIDRQGKAEDPFKSGMQKLKYGARGLQATSTPSFGKDIRGTAEGDAYLGKMRKKATGLSSKWAKLIANSSQFQAAKEKAKSMIGGVKKAAGQVGGMVKKAAKNAASIVTKPTK